MGPGSFPPLLYLRKCRNRRHSGLFRYLSQTRWCDGAPLGPAGQSAQCLPLVTAFAHDTMKLAGPASILLTTFLLLPTAEGESTEHPNVTSSASDSALGEQTVTSPALTGQTETSVMTTAPPEAQTSNEVLRFKPKANVSTPSVSEGSVSFSTSTMEPLGGNVTESTSTAGSDTMTQAEEHHSRVSVPSTSEPGGTKEPVQASDKRMLWCLVPVLGIVVAALAYGFKSKLRKGPTYPDTTENGTENASYQSRPENSKDGVMLLGVKSGGEDNAAAR
ncbi:uncharacterized protein LOC108938810 isoform X2 [Scleropages formosus]|uniref:uncharacterized protein LOC108938810 isoform X2 n=1 Tax=Scleropages formosus TaxID=113540 RepID=UPI000878E68A|nr:uncharacterized protein LOC108938810 isoform X2 [Scleropages formosus]